MSFLDAIERRTEPPGILTRSTLTVLVPLVLLASACSGVASTSQPVVAPAPADVSIPASPPPGPAAVSRPAPPAAPAGAAATPGDGYQPVVQLGNTTAFKSAHVPFALYINAIHTRLHPIFADEFLTMLSGQPASSPLNQDLRADLELVIDQKTGQLVKIGVIRPSGVAAFDRAALNAVIRAQPFGPAPEVIASPDGRVYVHWELHRDPFDACTTRNARPYMLKSAP
jgi:TonB family protein